MSSPLFDADAAAAAVMAAMLPLADAERAGQAKRYFKSGLDFLGVSVPGIRRRPAGGRHRGPAYVIAWTREHLDLMSGVTFREAVRRLPPEQAARLEAIRARTRFGEVSV